MISKCPFCSNNLKSEFRFCPFCGYELNKSIVCSTCQYENESNSKYCQECGKSLILSNQSYKSNNQYAESPQILIEKVEAPASEGITIEFPYSSSQSYSFAVETAEKFTSYKVFGKDKKVTHRVIVKENEIESLTELIDSLKGWRNRTVYLNGEKVPWDAIFSFNWCFAKKKVCFKPDYYCYGYEYDYQFNIWGCIQANLPFSENADWFLWGNWLNKKGDWKFDKDRITHELQKNLYKYRYCPALNADLIQDVIKAFPEIVNPKKDKNWKFVERWGDDNFSGLTIEISRFGYSQKVTMIGVTPNGRGAIRELTKKMSYKLPYLGM